MKSFSLFGKLPHLYLPFPVGSSQTTKLMRPNQSKSHTRTSLSRTTHKQSKSNENNKIKLLLCVLFRFFVRSISIFLYLDTQALSSGEYPQ